MLPLLVGVYQLRLLKANDLLAESLNLFYQSVLILLLERDDDLRNTDR